MAAIEFVDNHTLITLIYLVVSGAVLQTSIQKREMMKQKRWCLITQLVFGLIAITKTYAFSSVGSIIDQRRISSTNLFQLKIEEDEPSSPILPTIMPRTLLSMLTGNGGPPLRVDDTNVLLYDVLLLLNLSVSISFGVTHRMNLSYISSALDEGSLMCICWIIAGLANGVFLYSAVDGHYDPLGRGEDNGKGGPKAAGLLALSTFISASSIRILIALSCAVCQHRPVGIGGEELIPLEIVVGLALMSLWRAVHSSYTPRV